MIPNPQPARQPPPQASSVTRLARRDAPEVDQPASLALPPPIPTWQPPRRPSCAKPGVTEFAALPRPLSEPSRARACVSFPAPLPPQAHAVTQPARHVLRTLLIRGPDFSIAESIQAGQPGMPPGNHYAAPPQESRHQIASALSHLGPAGAPPRPQSAAWASSASVALLLRRIIADDSCQSHRLNTNPQNSARASRPGPPA